VQVVKPFCPIPLRLRDISAHPGADLEAQAYSFVHAEILKPFDLKNGPLIRAALLRLGPQHHILISTMHHIVSDGWSAELFVQELAEHYGAFSADRELSLNPLPMQYFDFTILQQRMIPGDRIQEQLSFWQRTLAGAPALHDFPCDRARPEEPTYAGASRTLKLDQELVADLQQFARRQRATFLCFGRDIPGPSLQIWQTKRHSHRHSSIGPKHSRNREFDRFIRKHNCASNVFFRKSVVHRSSNSGAQKAIGRDVSSGCSIRSDRGYGPAGSQPEL
jgi:hypothetical protein